MLSMMFVAAALISCSKSDQNSNAPTQTEIRTAPTKETVLPTFAEGDPYVAMRQKMLAAGWKPHTSAQSICKTQEEAIKIAECKETPELQSCAGNNLNQCEFTWTDGQRIATIETFGEKHVFGTVTFGQTEMHQAQTAMPASSFQTQGSSDGERDKTSAPINSSTAEQAEGLDLSLVKIKCGAMSSLYFEVTNSTKFNVTAGFFDLMLKENDDSVIHKATLTLDRLKAGETETKESINFLDEKNCEKIAKISAKLQTLLQVNGSYPEGAQAYDNLSVGNRLSKVKGVLLK